MKLETVRFGTLDIPNDEIVLFPGGLPGFEAEKRFVLIEDAALDPFVWLQSADNGELAFLLLPPQYVTAGYAPEMSDDARTVLGLAPDEQPESLGIVTMNDDLRQVTVNLRAPVLINRRRGIGRQEVATSTRYPVQFRVFPDDAPSDRGAAAGR